MKTTQTTHRHSSVIQDQITSIDSNVRLALIRHSATKLRHNFVSSVIKGDLVCQKGNDDLVNASNNQAVVIAVATSPMGQELTALSEIIRCIESSDEYAAAVKILAPLLAELEEATAAEAAAERVETLARIEREEKLAAAKAEALAEVEARFANA